MLCCPCQGTSPFPDNWKAPYSWWPTWRCCQLEEPHGMLQLPWMLIKYMPQHGSHDANSHHTQA